MTEEQVITCDYRFGIEEDIRNFITKNAFLVKRTAEKNDTTGKIITFNYEQVRYPLDIFIQPAPQGVFRYSRDVLWLYKVNKSAEYIWLYPSEVIFYGYGICIDTANLVQSLFEAIGYTSLLALGEIRKASDNELLGYHAWVEDDMYVFETTIHKGQGYSEDIIIPKSEAYENHKGYKYVPFLKYNSMDYKEVKQQVLKIAFFGPSKEFKNIKQWLKAEKKKQKILWGEETCQ
jgi:hypothetical protein